MNTPEHSLTNDDIFSIAELEARFEMQALPLVAEGNPAMDWACGCAFAF